MFPKPKALFEEAHLKLSLSRLTTTLRHLHTSLVAARRHIDTGISGEEIRGAQVHLMDFARHDWPIFNARVVGETEYTPYNHISVSGVVATGNSVRNTVDFLARLHGEAATGEEFVVFVFGDPDVMLSKLSTLSLYGSWVCEKELGSRGNKFVAYTVARDGVFDVLVHDLEDAVETRFSICPCGLLDRRLADFVVVSARVGFGVHGYSVGFFCDDCVAVTIDCRVNAESEDVLMVLGEYTRVDDVAVVAGLAGVDVDTADDTGCSSLDVDATRLVELVGEDVFVVGQGDDELDHQDTAASYDCAASAPVGVLPANTLILLMQADNVGVDLALTIIVDNDSVEVFNNTKTVTSERKIVGAISGATITKVKGLLSLEGRTSICVGDSHLADGKSVGDTSSIVVNIVNNGTLTRVERDTETPLLPFNQRLIADLE